MAAGGGSSFNMLKHRPRGKFKHNRWKKTHTEDDDSHSDSIRDKEKYKDLLVFGYACRLFRDDEKAAQIEKGKQLIPWMGDKSLLIDRYDCRGHLHDLAQYDSSFVSTPALPTAEDELERLAEEERYKDLHMIQNQQLQRNQQHRQQELEMEYLQATSDSVTQCITLEDPVGVDNVVPSSNAPYGAVGFCYGSSSSVETDSVLPETKNAIGESGEGQVKSSNQPFKDDSDLPEKSFIPRTDFEIPMHICLPQFDRINAIVERTAKFVAEKGAQLEIMIRAKQSSNESFSFLNPTDMLFPYYRFLVESIKNGSYKAPAEKESAPTPAASSTNASDAESDDDGDYLHPSLIRTSQPVAASSKPVDSVFHGPNPSSFLYNSLVQKMQVATPAIVLKSNVSMDKTVATAGPPADILCVIEKIATAVVKNGVQFEEMIQARHGPDDVKFGFVHGYHPYHSLYEETKRKAVARASTFQQRERRKAVNHVPVVRSVAPQRSAVVVDDIPPPPPPPNDTVTAVPSPPASPPPVVVVPEKPPEDPRIAELKKKALEASLRIAEKLKERRNISAPVVTPVPEVAPVISVASLMDTEKIPDHPTFTERNIKFKEVEPKPKPVLVNSSIKADPGSLLELLQLEQAKTETSWKRKWKKAQEHQSDDSEEDVSLKGSKRKHRNTSRSKSKKDNTSSKDGKRHVRVSPSSGHSRRKARNVSRSPSPVRLKHRKRRRSRS